MEEEPLKPEPRKRRKRSKSTQDNSPSIEENAEALAKLLKDALSIKKQKKRLEEQELETDALIATNQEFLKAFIIIGYDLQNKPVTLMHAKDQLDADALLTSLNRLFIEANGQKNNGF